MKKINRRKAGIFLVMLILGGLWLTGCKKYEDDPFISLRSPIHRMEGRRELTEFTIDGRDTLSYFTSRYGNFYFHFTTKTDGYGGFNLFVMDKATRKEISQGSWTYYNNGKNGPDAIGLDLPIYGGGFIIKKLTKKEVNLEHFGERFYVGDTIDWGNKILIKMQLNEYNL